MRGSAPAAVLYTPRCLPGSSKPLAPHLEPGQNKLTLDDDIPKLDQSMSDRGASADGTDRNS